MKRTFNVSLYPSKQILALFTVFIRVNLHTYKVDLIFFIKIYSHIHFCIHSFLFLLSTLFKIRCEKVKNEKGGIHQSKVGVSALTIIQIFPKSLHLTSPFCLKNLQNTAMASNKEMCQL